MHNNVNQDQKNTNFQHTVLCILSTILCVKHKRYNIDIVLNGTISVFAIRLANWQIILRTIFEFAKITEYMEIYLQLFEIIVTLKCS